jgi:urease accessory protein
MRARARIVAAGEHGRTRLVELRGEPPLLPRLTGPRGGPTAEVHLVGGAAGPLAGDDLLVEIEVGPGAHLRLHTVAASVALPSTVDAESRLEIRATVAAGGCLEWLPEPLIAAAGCHHRSLSTVDLAGGAALRWREELVCGRHGEDPGDARLTASVTYAGQPLYRNELTVGPRASGWTGAAVLAGGRAAGTMLVVDPLWTDGGRPVAATYGDTAARMPLAGPAVLVSAVGDDARQVRERLTGSG